MAVTINSFATGIGGGSSMGGNSVWGSITGTLADQTDLQTALNNAAAGGVTVVWQTYTPNPTNTVHIALNRSLGSNVQLGPPVDNTQVVDVPLNMADGQEMQIDLAGGAGSGSWTTWSSGAPSTPGYVFVQGAAPTAPASAASYVPCYVKRRGFKYEVVIGNVATI